MHPDRRRAGRAIRKQRRLQREAIKSVQTMDMRPIVEAFRAMYDAVAEAVGTLASFAEAVVADAWRGWQPIIRRWEWDARERRRKEFEWRLAHRALTTGRD